MNLNNTHTCTNTYANKYDTYDTQYIKKKESRNKIQQRWKTKELSQQRYSVLQL